ncbi:MAG TPA: ribonuclease P [Candidatus Thermoplasmatota archaeon]|nr:ribonuclease P [Candidatus Thermoplasmatota archaeon]
MPRRRDKGLERERARARIGELFVLAEARARAGDAERARRYVLLARRLGTRYLVRLPRELSRRHCKECNAYWLPGQARVRIRSRRVVATCPSCGAIRRFGVGPPARRRARATKEGFHGRA